MPSFVNRGNSQASREARRASHSWPHAEKGRGELPAARLRYLRHDLREPLTETGFDAAINIFSSLGYGTEDDDLAMLKTLRAAVPPEGLVLVETVHRDAAVAFFSRGASQQNVCLMEH